MRSLKYCLIMLTLVSVVSDSMMAPFIHNFFCQAFAAYSTKMVGYYLAASCITVIVAFPIWTRVAKRINELHLLVYTQIAAGILGLACYYSTTLTQFWILSQLMLVFKASYLLIYPYVLRLEERNKHLSMISIYSVLIHFGAIGGAVIGGFILQFYSAKDVYLVMPISDTIQVVVCLCLILKLKVPFKAGVQLNSKKVETASEHKKFILNLGVTSILFYFSVFLIRPFFSRYWESVANYDGEIVSGLMFSIPGWIALVGLWVNHRAKSSSGSSHNIIPAMLIATSGLLLQGIQQEWVVVLGRCIFGWGLFQATVSLEAFMFERSTPENYANDFSHVFFYQNLGVISASFLVGYIVDNGSLVTPFFIASATLILCIAYFNWAFKSKFRIKIFNVSEAK